MTISSTVFGQFDKIHGVSFVSIVIRHSSLSSLWAQFLHNHSLFIVPGDSELETCWNATAPATGHRMLRMVDRNWAPSRTPAIYRICISIRNQISTQPLSRMTDNILAVVAVATVSGVGDARTQLIHPKSIKISQEKQQIHFWQNIMNCLWQQLSIGKSLRVH